MKNILITGGKSFLAKEFTDFFYDKYNLIINKDFWETTDGYIDITYEWANGADMGIIIGYLNEMEEYEGNFVKNMLKIF